MEGHPTVDAALGIFEKRKVCANAEAAWNSHEGATFRFAAFHLAGHLNSGGPLRFVVPTGLITLMSHTRAHARAWKYAAASADGVSPLFGSVIGASRYLFGAVLAFAIRES